MAGEKQSSRGRTGKGASSDSGEQHGEFRSSSVPPTSSTSEGSPPRPAVVIVIVSHLQDPHAVAVLEGLGSWGRSAFLFDLADLPTEATLTVDYHEPARPEARLAHRRAGRIELSEASSVWWRRPQFVRLDDVTDPAAHGFTHGEWHEALYGVWSLLTCPWMNPPVRDEVASRKALPLAVASQLGLRRERSTSPQASTKARTASTSVGSTRAPGGRRAPGRSRCRRRAGGHASGARGRRPPARASRPRYG